MSTDAGPNGLLVIDKPAGVTSHDVVDRVRRAFRTKRVGHTGTLDPDATGVLVLCLGRSTRLAEYLTASAKHYEAEFVFGARTDTMDGSGAVIAETDASALTEPAVRAHLPAFRGKIHQTPPMVSARHHEGRRLYELAREGVTVERAPREVEVSEFELRSFVQGPRPRAQMAITCSSGTYIRVLADDLGMAAGFGAYMSRLRRTWVGPDAGTGFTEADAVSLADLEAIAARKDPAEALLPLSVGLKCMPQYRLSEQGLKRLRNGQPVASAEVAAGSGTVAGSGLAAVLDDEGGVYAIVRCEAESLHPIKVLAA